MTEFSRRTKVLLVVLSIGISIVWAFLVSLFLFWATQEEEIQVSVKECELHEFEISELNSLVALLPEDAKNRSLENCEYNSR